MSKRMCGSCKEYFYPEQMFISDGVQAFCTKECLKKKRYRPGFTPKRTIPKPIREAVRSRDRNICAYCGRSHSKDVRHFLQLHHILYRSEGGQHVPENLVTLCQTCHNMVHADKKRWQGVLLTYVDRMLATGSRGSLANLEKVTNKEKL